MNMVMDKTLVVQNFYQAFSDLDAEKMVGFYHDEVRFEDPAFGPLEGEDARDMWRFLVMRGKDSLEIRYGNIEEVDGKVRAEWVASYLYGPVKRRVINFVNATFEIDDSGKILSHKDKFSLWKWSRQALGFHGLLLGWTPWLHGQIRAQSLRFLQIFQSKKSK